MLQVGATFIGNINKHVFTVINITPNWYRHSNSKIAIVKDHTTGKQYKYGYDALNHCLITVLREDE